MADQNGVLSLAEQLAAVLNAAGTRSFEVVPGLPGAGPVSEDHLALVVDRADAWRCFEAMSVLGLQSAAAGEPGRVTFTGSDPGTGRTVRVDTRFYGADVHGTPRGGVVLAVLGADGSGKSTVVDDVAAFLSRQPGAPAVHAGKRLPLASVKVARKLLRHLPRRVSITIPTWEADRLTEFPGYVYLISHLLTAHEAYRSHLAERRAAARGTVVIRDRYPVAGLETMDCARLQSLPGVERRPLARWMRRREHEYYRKIEAPDGVIVLRTDPEVAVARRPEKDAAFVSRRAEEIHQRVWAEPNVYVVDANRPLEQVQAEVRSLVWAVVS